jgi:hypothetical protein
MEWSALWLILLLLGSFISRAKRFLRGVLQLFRIMSYALVAPTGTDRKMRAALMDVEIIRLDWACLQLYCVFSFRF